MPSRGQFWYVSTYLGCCVHEILCQQALQSDILPPTPALTRLVVRRAPVISEVRLGDIRRFGQNLEELILKDVTSVDSETSQAQIPLPSSLRKLTMLRTGCFDRTTAYRNRFLRRIVPETGLPLLSEVSRLDSNKGETCTEKLSSWSWAKVAGMLLLN